MSLKLDAFIISWPGKHDNAEILAQSLLDKVDRLTVLYSQNNDKPKTGTGLWQRFPNEWYFGKQFKNMIDHFDGDILLHVMADVRCDDWNALVGRLRDAFENLHELGVWSPNVDYSGHHIDRISLGPIFRSGVHAVVHTDETVWAMSRDVVMQMRRYDYANNNLGWGIDIAAAFYCHSVGKPVVLDTEVDVHHPRSTAYNAAEAQAQMTGFFRQMPARQKRYLILRTRPMVHSPWLRKLCYWTLRSIGDFQRRRPERQARAPLPLR